VAQDGLEDHPVPWGLIDALFIGGTTEFKMGPVAAAAAQQARLLGKWVHMGRVNTRRRIRYAKSLGCDSMDGTSFSRFRRTTLPWALTWASAEQLWEAV
jgi:EAL domain-containing protein (putative c-di-GMP-specific phosphodiesterase class I)